MCISEFHKNQRIQSDGNEEFVLWCGIYVKFGNRMERILICCHDHERWLKTTCHSAPWFMPVGLRTLRKVLLIFRNYGESHLLWSVIFSANLWYLRNTCNFAELKIRRWNHNSAIFANILVYESYLRGWCRIKSTFILAIVKLFSTYFACQTEFPGDRHRSPGVLWPPNLPCEIPS